MSIPYTIITSIYSNKSFPNTFNTFNTYNSSLTDYSNSSYGNEYICKDLITTTYENGICSGSNSLNECCDYISNDREIIFNYCINNTIYNCVNSNYDNNVEIIHDYLNNLILWSICIVVVLMVLICIILVGLYVCSKSINSEPILNNNNNNNYQRIDNN